ncbi:MAG TPA: response regulator [Candidatus Paenibacillus intestinavium]|nr:response regulator [Candidatus Paenibacillus intestinavium]
MPTILIVDDETIFRTGLKKMIQELDKDWEIVGEARDGIEALEQVDKLQPDAILTDIRMPRMDGIQLQRKIAEQFPTVLCVVISGYDDFIYVQQSMRQGAKDYIMKPIEREELSRSLFTMKEKIQQQVEASQQQHVNKREQIERAREHIVTGLLCGKLQKKDFEPLLGTGIIFKEKWNSCIVLQLDKQSVEEKRYNQADPSLFVLFMQQLVQEILDRRFIGICCSPTMTEVVVIVNHEEREGARQEMMELGETIRRQVTSLSNMTVTIGIGCAYDRIEDIPQSYQEAQQAFLQRLLLGGDRVYRYESDTQLGTPQHDYIPLSWDQIENSFQDGKVEELFTQVERYVYKLCRDADSPQLVQQQICKMFIHYCEWANQLRLTKQWLGTDDVRSVLLHICSISTEEELSEELGKMLVKLMHTANSNQVLLEQDPIEKTVKFIEKHFSEQLTLKDVADTVFLNSAYFSSLFKQRTGTSFVEKLNEVRIAEAKKRMAYSDQKLVVIAEQIGFTNIRHFNRVFKSETGMSPTEYREK